MTDSLTKDPVRDGYMATKEREVMTAEEQLYYVQDTRSVVGNSMVWWAKDGHGYVCDIRKAHVWGKDEAYKQHAMRSTDLPWPKSYIDSRISHHIDVQHCDKSQREAV